MTDREAYIILNMLSGIGPARLSMLLNFCGSPSEIFSQDRKSLSSIQGISASLAEKICEWEKHVALNAELTLAERGGVRIITRGEEGYPELLSEIHDAPICLYIRGELPENISRSSLAIVGTRNMTTYGQRMARHLAEAAAFSGWTVVSGLAYGVDAVAHQAVLDAGGKTVAVLGGGLARVQPQEHLPLARDISVSGAVISEFPMEFSPTRHSFPMRNRIISGLSKATLVIEAGRNSGSLITAAAALEQGRTVFAVPGQADNPQASGCNQLIRQGAVLAETFDHILEEFDFLPGFSPKGENMICEETPGDSFFDNSSEISMTADNMKILEFLNKGDAFPDAIAENTGIPAGEIIGSLISLELLRKVKKTSSGAYHRLR